MHKYFEFYSPTKINCGKAALSTIGTELEYFGSSHPMVLASANATRMGACDKVIAAMKGGSIKASVVLNNVPARIDLAFLRDAKAKYAEAGCDGIVAIGGEGVMDNAKALKLFLSENCDDLLPLAGVSKKIANEIPLITVPTECGSGHEASGNVEHEDTFISSPVINPNVVIIDEEVSAIAPARMTAANGVYTLANAIEAYLGADDIAIIEVFAQKAVRLIFDHLLRVVKDEEAEEDCIAISLASVFGGIAYGNVPYGAAHALAEALADVSNEPIEEMMAISLLSVLKNLSEKQKEKLVGLLPYTCSIEKLSEIPESERKHKVVENIEALIEDLREAGGIPVRLSETKVQRETFGAISDAAQDKRSAIAELAPIGQETFLKLLNDAF